MDVQEPLPKLIEINDSPAFQTPAWAWGVCWLMFASTVLNYMDRQAISLVEPFIHAEFHLSNADFGWVMAAFQLSYAVFQVPAGFLADRWDVRRTYAGAVAFWSLAGIGSAFAPGLGSLVFFRALLGVGESFNWPCALRVTAQILPPSDRSLGNGIFNSGAAVGAVVSPILVTLLSQNFGWRTSFVIIGALGFVWVAAWLAIVGRAGSRFQPVHQNSPTLEDSSLPPLQGLSSPAILAYSALVVLTLLIASSSYWRGLWACWWAISFLMFGVLLISLALPERLLEGSPWASSLGRIVRMRRFWVLVVVSLSINVCWHFLVMWMPGYLRKDRGMTYLASGLWTAVPFLAADFGNLGGGALSRFIASRGLGVVRSRGLVMAFCTLLISSGAWLGRVESNILVIVLLILMAMGTAAFMANYFAFAQEVSPQHTGLIVGLLGGLGNLLAAGILPFAGLVKDRTGGFGPIFVLVGLVPFLGLATLLLGWGRDAKSSTKPA